MFFGLFFQGPTERLVTVTCQARARCYNWVLLNVPLVCPTKHSHCCLCMIHALHALSSGIDSHLSNLGL